MTVVEKSVLIEYTVAQMFELVDRVEDYPQFLPWCEDTDLIDRTDSKTAATIYVSYHGIGAHFSTENAKEFPNWMTIKLIEGPFKRFEGNWSFAALNETACKVVFRLDYEFSNRLLGKVLGPLFSRITNTLVDSFVKQAHLIYG